MSLLFILLIICVQSCRQTITKMEIYDQYRNQQIELRDSLLVIHTVKEWGHLNWWAWGVREDLYHISQNEVQYFIGGTFYNLDKTKMLVWVGEEKPNAKSIETYNEDPEVNKICPNGSEIIFSMSALIGVRETPNSVWKLYPFDKKQATCFDSKEKVINVLGQYYFEQMAEHSEYVSKAALDENYGGKVRYDLEDKKKYLGYSERDNILKNYGYNLQDENFWKKSLIWQKGAKVKGYYNFQLYNNKPWNLPKIDYPKEVLDLYE